MPTATPRSFVPDGPTSTPQVPRSFVPDTPGAEAPPQAPKLMDKLRARGTKILETRQRHAAGEQGTISGQFEVGGHVFGAVGDVGGAAVDTVLRATGLDKPIQKVTEKIAAQPVVQKVAGKISKGYEKLTPEQKRSVDALMGYASGISTVTGAGAVAGPIAKVTGKAASTAAKGAATAGQRGASAMTGVPRDVLARAASPERAAKIEKAITHVTENDKQPFFKIANETADKINAADRNAAERLNTEIMFFKADNPKATFDVASKFDDIAVSLKPFRTSGLIVEPELGPRGKVLNYKVSATPQSPFTDQEIKAINHLLGKIKASTDVSVDDLMALRKSFNTAFNAIRLGENGEYTPYHAVIMAMKGPAEDVIDKILPPSLKQANMHYRAVQEMKDAFGHRIVDVDGNLKDNAEQFLANLGNQNKGNIRAAVERMRELTGLDILDEIEALKDAQKLAPFFPATGSRTQDIMRSLLATGVGAAALGPLGGLGVAAASSPRVAGKIATTMGKLRAKRQSASTSDMTKYPPTQPSAQSNKNASIPQSLPPKQNRANGQRGFINVGAMLGIGTKKGREAVEDHMRDVQDAVVRALKVHIVPKTGRRLNFDIHEDVQRYLSRIAKIRNPKPSDFAEGLELIRLRGGDAGHIRRMLTNIPRAR